MDTSTSTDVRMHRMAANDGEIVVALEEITHYSDRPDTIICRAVSETRGGGRDAKSYEDAVRIVEEYVRMSNNGASAAELDSII